MDLKDLGLVKKWLAGDTVSGLFLINGSYEKVHRIVQRRLSYDTPNFINVVEEITQEAFTIALEKIDTYDGSASFASWVWGCARNVLRARRRELLKWANISEFIEESVPPSEEISYFGNPAFILEKKERQETARAAFLSLSIDYQEIIYYHSILGFTYRDTVLELGKTEDALRNLHFRAMTQLRERFDEIYFKKFRKTARYIVGN